MNVFRTLPVFLMVSAASEVRAADYDVQSARSHAAASS
jgi:hypothetical protein